MIVHWLSSSAKQGGRDAHPRTRQQPDTRYKLVEVHTQDGSDSERTYEVFERTDISTVLGIFNRRTLAIQDKGYSRRNLDDYTRRFCKYDPDTRLNSYIELYVTSV